MSCSTRQWLRGPRSIALAACAVVLGSACAIGPAYDPELRAEDSGVDAQGAKVVVTRFYKAESELSYLGDLDISIILESAKLRDISFAMASHLKRAGISAEARKNAPVEALQRGEVMLTGSLVTRSIPMEENFPFPGMMVILLIGNVLPTPYPYVSGVDVAYRYELVDDSGRILFASPEKETRIYYRDFWIWGRIFFAKGYERDINDQLEEQVFDLIAADLFE